MDNYELYHFGVKGMKWGVRKKLQEVASNREKKKITEDAKRVEARAKKSNSNSMRYAIGVRPIYKTAGVGYYANHIIDKNGKVKLSTISVGSHNRTLASGKKYVEQNIKLSDFFREPSRVLNNIEYDVYD